MSKQAGAIGLVVTACALHAVGAELQELPDMVVTPSGQAMEVEATGHSISVITAAEIEAAGWRTLPEALRAIPGLYLSQSGSPGSTVSLSIRGSRSAQVLVLVDGVRLNDPSGPTREAEIQSIDLANVERIEVVRGPLSGLYGSDATTGVIHVITKRGTAGVTGSVFAEGGSYGTYRVGGRLSSGNADTQVTVDAAYLQSDGFSAADEALPGNREDDGVETLNLRFTADHRVNAGLRLDASLHYIDTEADYDSGAGPFADAAGNVAKVEQVLVGARARIGQPDAAWQQALRLQYSFFDRAFDDAFGSATYEGEQLDTDWRHTVVVGTSHHLTLGVDMREESAKSFGTKIGDVQTLGVYLQDHFSTNGYALLAGVRYDEHEEFGGEATWRLAPSYRIASTATRLKGSVGTSFKAPSLFQLYAPAGPFGPVGNTDLDPEQSLAWDAGLEQVLLDGMLVVDVTYFRARVKDQIDFVVGYQNVSRVETEGVEVSARVSPLDTLDLTAFYTYTDAEDEDTGNRLIRVPRDRAALRADWRPHRQVGLSSTVRYVGAFDDRYFDNSMFTTVDTRVASSVVVDLSGTYDVSERLQLFGRVDNLFDEDYQEIAGYGTAGVSGYGGVRLKL